MFQVNKIHVAMIEVQYTYLQQRPQSKDVHPVVSSWEDTRIVFVVLTSLVRLTYFQRKSGEI